MDGEDWKRGVSNVMTDIRGCVRTISDLSFCNGALDQFVYRIVSELIVRGMEGITEMTLADR